MYAKRSMYNTCVDLFPLNIRHRRPELATLAASPVAWAAVAGLGITALAVKALFEKGSRKYDGNVGAEYDAWTSEGILEYYWGEHIHLGYYNDAERAAGYRKKNFKQVCGAEMQRLA